MLKQQVKPVSKFMFRQTVVSFVNCIIAGYQVNLCTGIDRAQQRLENILSPSVVRKYAIPATNCNCHIYHQLPKSAVMGLHWGFLTQKSAQTAEVWKQPGRLNKYVLLTDWTSLWTFRARDIYPFLKGKTLKKARNDVCIWKEKPAEEDEESTSLYPSLPLFFRPHPSLLYFFSSLQLPALSLSLCGRVLKWTTITLSLQRKGKQGYIFLFYWFTLLSPAIISSVVHYRREWN